MTRRNTLIDTFLTRTNQGMDAFEESVSRAHPARIAYLAAGAASVVAATTRSTALTKLTKPVLMPLLVADVLFPDATVTRQRRLKSRVPAWKKVLGGRTIRPGTRTAEADNLVLAAGLIAGWLGDLKLMNEDSRSADPQVRAKNLNQGAAAFALNHAAYIHLLRTRGARADAVASRIRAAAVAGGAALTAARAPKALPAALGYGTILATTSAMGDAERPHISHGGNLFVISDGLILTRLTMLRNALAPSAPAVAKAIDGALDGAVMATYVIAQMLLVDGLRK